MTLADKARILAPQSNHSLHKHVVFVFKRNRPLCWAVNLGWRHAEERALGKIPYDKRKGVIVYSFRIGKNGTIRNAKPCENCEKFMRAYGVAKVYYSDTNGNMQCMEPV